MVDVKKINLIAYAGLKHLQGYKILKNPNGTNPYELNMIKYKHGLTVDCDEVFLYKRINKTFNSFIPKSSNKTLISKRVFDTASNKPSKKKNITIYGCGVLGYFRNRIDVPEKNLNSRIHISKREKNQTKFDTKEITKYSYIPKSNWDVCNEVLTAESINTHNYQKLLNNSKFDKFIAILKENLSQK